MGKRVCSPCYECKERHEICHDTCSAFKDYRQKLEKEKQIQKKGKNENRDFKDYVIGRNTKAIFRKFKSRKK